MSRRTATADVFQALADPTRRGLLDLLRGGEMAVNELASRFDVSLSAISQHLRILREAGLVRTRRAGRERRYLLSAEPIREIADWAGRYEQFWNDRLDALGRELKEDEWNDES